MIDNVMIMNLKRREDKWYFALGWLAKLDFPMNETIIRFESHDGESFDSTDAVVNAAVADGFPHFERERRIVKHRDVAWMWTWVSVLRKIIEMDKTVLLLIDDTLPVWSWERLIHLVRHVKSEEPEDTFKLIQLNHMWWIDRKMPDIKVTDMILAKGVNGQSDFGSILTPVGAQFLLEEHIQTGGLPPSTFYNIMRREEKKGVWHTLDDVVKLSPYPWKSDLYM